MLTVALVLGLALLLARAGWLLRRIRGRPAPETRGERLLFDLLEELRGLRGDLKDERVTRAAQAAADKFDARKARRLQPPAAVEDDDEKTNVVTFPKPVDGSPPRYARRPLPPEPLADPDLVGTEDAADAAEEAKLGSDEKTPPRRRPLLVPVYRDPSEGEPA